MQSKKYCLGILITLLGGSLWGLSGACGQYLFSYPQAGANWLVPIRLTSAGILLLLYYLIKDRRLAMKIWKNKTHAFTLISYGIFGMMLCQYSYFSAIGHSNAGTATVLQYLAPVLIMLVMCIREKRLPGRTDVLCVILSLSGIFLLATHGNPGRLVVSTAALFWGLFSAVTVVFYNLIPRKLMDEYPAPLLLGWAMVIGGSLLCLVSRPWNYHPVLDVPALACLLTIILLGTVASFSLYMQGVKYIGPEKASLYACIEPVAATAVASLWLKVPFTLMDIAGFGLILSTIFLMALYGKKAAPEAPGQPYIQFTGSES